MTGFQTRFADTATSDFRLFALLKPIDYYSAAGVHYLMPEGAQSDLTSIPRELWSLLPTTGEIGAEYALAAYLHDCAYRNTLQIVQLDGSAIPANLAKPQCDSLLKEAMLVCQVPIEIVDTIYEAVNIAGTSSFNNDR